MNVNINGEEQKKLLDLQALLADRLGIEVSFSQLLGWLLNVGGGVLSGKMIFVPVEDHDRDASECAALERAELTAAISSIASKTSTGLQRLSRRRSRRNCNCLHPGQRQGYRQTHGIEKWYSALRFPWVFCVAGLATGAFSPYPRGRASGGAKR